MRRTIDTSGVHTAVINKYQGPGPIEKFLPQSSGRDNGVKLDGPDERVRHQKKLNKHQKKLNAGIKKN